MKRSAVGILAVVALAGCQRAGDAPPGPGAGADSRYLGVGVYSPGRMWAQIERPQGQLAAGAATLRDDEQVIVVVDSKTGEVRQCGNLSGFCVTNNPWAGTASPAPAALAKPAAAPVPEALGSAIGSYADR